MGLLDGILGGGARPQQTPGLGGTLAAGVILALLVKAVRHYQASHGQAPAPDGRSFDPQAQGQPAQGGGLGGILGGLGGLLGGGGGMMGGGLGGLLGSLGGAGALGGLIGHLQQNGLGPQVGSWVGQGRNAPVAPQQLASALGEPTIQQLQQQTGMDRDQLMNALAHELPEAINQATPSGGPPASDEELHEIARRPAASA
jgi:uncharacterized protein YidB (DUF937 family)